LSWFKANVLDGESGNVEEGRAWMKLAGGISLVEGVDFGNSQVLGMAANGKGDESKKGH
jgi:hypothetical protein